MSKKDYSIDDILLEAEKLKRMKAGSTSGNHDDLPKGGIKADLENSASDGTVFTEEISEEKKEDFFSFVDGAAEKAREKEKTEEEAAPPPRRNLKRRLPPVTEQAEAEEASKVVPEPRQNERGAASPKKKDLFDFTPQKRERPSRQGAYGKQKIDFTAEEVAPKQVEKKDFPQEPDSFLDETFDFDSISDKIDKMNKKSEVPAPSPRKGQSPFNFGQPAQSISDKAKHRSRYADLASGVKPTAPGQRFSFDFNKNNPHASADGSLAEDDGDYPKQETTERKSIFSTFSGTGKELKLEDIKRIDFSEVEGAGGGYYDEDEFFYDEYENDVPDGVHIDLNEFRQGTDRRDVSRDIATTKMGIFIRTLITGFVTLLLFYFVLAAKYPSLPMLTFLQPEKGTLNAYLIACTILMGIIGVVCGNVMVSGVVSTFRMRANSDSLAAFAVIGAVVQGIFAVRNPDLLNLPSMSLYFPVAALSMLFNCIGKMSMLGRIQQNFRIVAANQPKNTVLTVESPAFSREVMPSITHRRPTIAYSAPGEFFTDFLALSFSNKYDVGVNRSVAPVCLIGATVVALATRFISANPMTAATAFAGVLCVCATFSTAFIENVPLGKMAKKLTPMGAMVSGNKAVETFCDTNAVILTETDLFPKGHVYLNGIKAFPNARIDEAILDAASVLCALGGSLSHVFLDMIGGDKQLLKKVDNVVFENGMGLSGWVDQRRVLIGNRALMHNHGVPLPADSYERAHPKDAPGNPIYLSNSGEVSARFLVEYLIDEELAGQLDLMAMREKRLIVYTTDANIDTHKIWELYGYPLDLITVMPAELQDGFREMSQPRPESPAEIVYIGRSTSFIAAILATINARSSILSATVIQLAQIIIGYGLMAVMAFMGYIENFSMIQLMVYQLFWFVAIMVLQQTRKP